MVNESRLLHLLLSLYIGKYLYIIMATYLKTDSSLSVAIGY